ncbi:MAG: hypothetical protein KDB27_21865 [Planctomycetales bacterium]|nr:hypothetical protein [Planctomycetales bacterium]
MNTTRFCSSAKISASTTARFRRCLPTLFVLWFVTTSPSTLVAQSVFANGSVTEWLQEPVVVGMGVSPGTLHTCSTIEQDGCVSDTLPALSTYDSGYGLSEPLMISYLPDVSEKSLPITINFSIGRSLKKDQPGLGPSEVVQSLLGNIAGNLPGGGSLKVLEVVANVYASDQSSTFITAAPGIVLHQGDQFNFGPHYKSGEESYSGNTLRTDFTVVVEFDNVVAGQTRLDIVYPSGQDTKTTTGSQWFAGDGNGSGTFCSDDFIPPLNAAIYNTTNPADWLHGDWNDTPVDSSNPDPPGDSLFNERDLIAAFATGLYEKNCTTSNAKAKQMGVTPAADVIYNTFTGELTASTKPGTNLTSLLIKTVDSDFSSLTVPQELDGPFDFRNSERLFKAAIDNTVSFAPFGPAEVVFGSLAAGLKLTDFGETIATFFDTRDTHAIKVSLDGDTNGDGVVNVHDINLISQEILAGNYSEQFDLNSDGDVSSADFLIWVKDIRNTWIGDANLDGEFNSSDFVAVFSVGQYETGQAASWQEGDWNADGLFDSGDFVAAFSEGGYEAGGRLVQTVPEPCCAFGLWSLLVLVVARRRRHQA